jgi:hypothetical protein
MAVTIDEITNITAIGISSKQQQAAASSSK